nr:MULTISPECIES: pyruvate, phosphate dikinase [unclassified Enterococcus]
MKNVYRFTEGNASMKSLLGGKGANLAEMTRLGLPVPPGFTVTTEACMSFLETGSYQKTLQTEIEQAIRDLELATGKAFNSSTHLLLVSVRSGAQFSMPGMMDTILNLGLNDQNVKALAKLTNNDTFAYDCYRRLLQMFGDVVFSIPKSQFDSQIAKHELNFDKNVSDFSKREFEILIQSFHQVYQINQYTFPQNPYLQLEYAIQAVFNSWNNHRAKVYRSLNQIDDALGTAVNIQSMVFGNSGQTSGTGVAFTRNPSTGENKLFGEFLINAQGEDVVAGLRTPQPLESIRTILPEAFDEFQKIAHLLEGHYRDMQDLEFTIEQGKLYILQTRNGKRSAKAALKIAVDLVTEKISTKEAAILKMRAEDINQLLHPIFVESELKKATLLASGLPASPGAAVGKIVFTAERAKELVAFGEKVVLVRRETSPEDIEGLLAAEAIVTTYGGMTSHAAVVARGMGTCCVTGCEAAKIEEAQKIVRINNQLLTEGDIISVDGTTGRIYIGEIETELSKLDENFQSLMQWCDAIAKVKVYANAETILDLRTALDFGAQGVGLARTEHMFFGVERLRAMRQWILTEQKSEALAQLISFQTVDFYQMFKLTKDKPMIIRLLDPPMHEFLPHGNREIQKVAKELSLTVVEVEQSLAALAEVNPMLGHRGVRIGVTAPDIYQMQVTAIIKSAIKHWREGLRITPKIMIPLIAEASELILVKQQLIEQIQTIFQAESIEIPYEIGTMIELPRACLVANDLAENADFFSFGTNDLTQMTYGFSRDDIGKFIGDYQEKGLLVNDPFQVLDIDGVGQLVEMAVQKGRSVKPNLSIGVCGEVGGNPPSIAFFQKIGVNYVSCSPYRVPIARLTVAKEAIHRLS